MAKEINKLSAAFIAKTSEPGLYGDGLGLYLKVAASTAKPREDDDAETARRKAEPTKSWVFRYMIGGKARSAGLGDIKTYSLKEARDRARDFRQRVKDGIDPIAEREATKAKLRAEDAKAINFEEATERYIAAFAPTWKNAKHGAQWTATLKNYAFATIGKMRVGLIDTPHILEILRPIWSEKPETASRVRGRIELILDWAKAGGLRKGENPARLRGHLDKLLPKRSNLKNGKGKAKHHEAMPYADLPDFMERLRDMTSVSARALEFTILTAARTGEVRGLVDGEVDFATKVWTVPAGRIKAGREHRVPLCDRAIEILREAKREAKNPHLFVGGKTGKGLSDMALLEVLRGMTGGKGLTVHGFRSSFRDWAAECTNFPREIAEAALAHIVGDETERAYRRGDALDKRRRLMDAWAGYCATKPAASGDKVTPIRRAG